MILPHTPAGSASAWRPVDPPRRPVLFVNPRSGGGKAARADLGGRARERGIEAVILDPGQDLTALARGAAAGGAGGYQSWCLRRCSTSSAGCAPRRRTAGHPGR